MSIPFAALLLAGFGALSLACWHLFGDHTPSALEADSISHAIWREEQLHCSAIAITVDRQSAVAQTAQGELVVVMTLGRHKVVRRLRPGLAHPSSIGGSALIRLRFSDFTMSTRELEFGDPSLARAWSEALQDHLVRS